MPSTLSLLDKVKADNPNFTFVDGDTFLWLPDTRTVFYDSSLADGDALLLHEVSHGLLNHQEYKRDVELLAIEAAAWDKAKLLAKEYGYAIDSAISEDHLDTYRDWLHARSTCPECTATGYQSGNDSYSCPACTTQWRVNEARVCELRRYKQKLPL